MRCYCCAALVIFNINIITIIACISVKLHCCKHARLGRAVRLSSDSGGGGLEFCRFGLGKKEEQRGIVEMMEREGGADQCANRRGSGSHEIIVQG